MPHSYKSRWAWLRWTGLLLCLVLAGGRAQGQTATGQQFMIMGRVVDAAGQGLPGATILVRGTGLGTATNAEGRYTLSATKPAGDYALVASLVGYKSETQTVALGPGTTVTTDFKLT